MNKLLTLLLAFFPITSFAGQDFEPADQNPITLNTAKALSKMDRENEIAKSEDAKRKTIEYYEKRKQRSVDVKRDFERLILRNWDVPTGSMGKTVKVLIELNDDGTVKSVTFDSSDPVFNESIKQAIENSAPFPLPNDYVLRQMSKKMTSIFKAR
ncbi:cell envelope integrity protein TolA [Acinetobacter stercoris]|uniref:TonB C-terminal domain-containing protein n=1 Tax=Acinetobacter stercoris TaxID=2126983 RepID=A0A2U3MZD1_9GAMM|nr:cell envelope integrity protein TolA [Acinetobacter stercoris]SPL70777.1 hypothetical protein KPC_1955 [Acinetobacter stercoris]